MGLAPASMSPSSGEASEVVVQNAKGDLGSQVDMEGTLVPNS